VFISLRPESKAGPPHRSAHKRSGYTRENTLTLQNQGRRHLVFQVSP